MDVCTCGKEDSHREQLCIAQDNIYDRCRENGDDAHVKRNRENDCTQYDQCTFTYFNVYFSIGIILYNGNKKASRFDERPYFLIVIYLCSSSYMLTETHVARLKEGTRAPNYFYISRL